MANSTRIDRKLHNFPRKKTKAVTHIERAASLIWKWAGHDERNNALMKEEDPKVGHK